MPTPSLIPLNDGRSMPQLGFGTGPLRPPDAEDAIKDALAVGYRSIDTAAVYQNEEDVGRAIRASGIGREDLFVTTKVADKDHGRDTTLRAFDESLKRLGLDYVDLYLIHWPVPKLNRYVETWAALVELRKEGRARSVGVSNFNADHLERVIDATGVVPAVNQVELHPLFQQRPLRAVHERLGIRTEGYSPLGVNRVLSLPAVSGIAERLGRTPAQVVLAWHLARGFITIPKSAHPGRMRENWDSLSIRLSGDDLARLDALDENMRLAGDPEVID